MGIGTEDIATMIKYRGLGIPDPFMLMQYNLESPPRYWSASSFPSTPVDPTKLSNKVISKLKEYGNKIPSQTSIMIEDVCKTFNESIRINKEKDMPTTFILSPKTGSGKSTIAKVYVSSLEDITSLIVVPRVSDAIEFCKDINNLRKDDNYAKCIYRVSDDNPESEFRIDVKDINNYPCVLMTHKMLEVASSAGVPVSKYLEKQPRDLVIIDERLQLKDPQRVTYAQIISFKEFLEKLESEYGEHYLRKTIEQLDEVLKLFDKLEEVRVQINERFISFNYILDSGYDKTYPIPLEPVNKLFNSTLTLKNIFNPSDNSQSDKAEVSFRQNWLKVIYSLDSILTNFFYYYKEGNEKYIATTNNIRDMFDSIVVLDATADVNEYYNTLSYTNHMTVQCIETLNPRKYGNLTFNICPGVLQSKDSILKDKDESGNKYISIARSLVTDSKDKLLVICHKGLLTYLEALNTNENILFTNWGNHVGKNEWSDCNKVLMIGWNYLPTYVHYDNIVNAIRNPVYVDEVYTSGVLKTYKNTQLADDIVQAVMRCRARVIDDTDGNCKAADIYMFTKSKSIEDDEVIKLVLGQFQDASLVEWKPTIKIQTEKKGKTSTNIEIIIDYLKSIENTKEDVSQSTIIQNTPLSKSTVSRLYNKSEFDEAIKEAGFSKCRIDGKSNGIRLEP